MRSFILTLLLFAVLMVLIVCNFIFINRTVDELLGMIDRLPAAPGSAAVQAAAALTKRWDEVHPHFSYSVSTIELDHVTTALTVLNARCAAGDADEYQCTLAQLRLAVSELGRLERFSVLNLL